MPSSVGQSADATRTPPGRDVRAKRSGSAASGRLVTRGPVPHPDDGLARTTGIAPGGRADALCGSDTKDATMPTGKVKWFNATKGYGFIEPSDGSKDVFVHISAVEQAGMSTLNENQPLSYEMEQGRNGKTSAINLKTQ